MTQHTQEQKRIKTHTMGSADIDLATSVTQDGVSDVYVFQDDIRLVGFMLGCELEVLDAASNVDGQWQGIVELSRSGKRSQDGSIGRIEHGGVWNGIFFAGEIRRVIYNMFAEGYGFDFDSGETINLLHFAYYIGAGGPIPWYPEAILYYVER